MSKTRIELSASGAKTASGNTDSFKVSTITMAMVGVDITAVSSVSDFTAFLQGSDDGGTTWYDLPADLIEEHDGGQSAGTIGSNDRDICDGITATGKHVAIYKHLPCDYVRLAWYLSGTSITFSASLVGA